MAGPGPAADLVQEHAYRARAVAEPRAVLREFGVELDDDVEVRVYDSSAEVRYLVLPMRPAGTEGWSEDELRALVTPRQHDRHRRPAGADDDGAVSRRRRRCARSTRRWPATRRCRARTASSSSRSRGRAARSAWACGAGAHGRVWPEFREHLVAAIEARPRAADETDADAYYGAWLDAVEALLAARGQLPAPA